MKPKKDEAALDSLNLFTRNKAAKDCEAAEKKYEAYLLQTRRCNRRIRSRTSIFRGGYEQQKRIAHQGLAERAKETRRQALRHV